MSLKINRQARHALRAARAVITAENKRWPVHLVEVPPECWPETEARPIAVWRSRTIAVQVYQEGEGWVRLSIARAALDSHGNWKDGLTWDDLQRIKNDVGFADRDAVEVFPAAKDVVNVANIRHLWVSPVPLAITWR